MPLFKVYKATFPDQSYYIGLTRRSLSHRISQHKTRFRKGSHSNVPLYSKMESFGLESIKWEIQNTFELLHDAEKEEMNLIDLNCPLCLNIMKGGMKPDNKNIEHRRRVSEGLKGRVITYETRERIGQLRRDQARKEQLRRFDVIRSIYIDGMSLKELSIKTGFCKEFLRTWRKEWDKKPFTIQNKPLK